MSKPKKTSSSAAPPAPPPPQNEYYYENDLLRSQRVFDPTKKAYVSKSFSTPTEQNIENQATDYMGKLVGQIPNAVNLSPEAIKGYGDAYSAPQIAALNQSYDRAKGVADMQGGASGMRNSVGFARYGANELEKNRAQGLADIAANQKMMELDLPNKLLMPYANQFNLYNAAVSGQQANIDQNANYAMQGSVNAQNAANQNYQNQMNYWNAKQQQQQQPARGGLFSFFTGGL